MKTAAGYAEHQGSPVVFERQSWRTVEPLQFGLGAAESACEKQVALTNTASGTASRVCGRHGSYHSTAKNRNAIDDRALLSFSHEGCCKKSALSHKKRALFPKKRALSTKRRALSHKKRAPSHKKRAPSHEKRAVTNKKRAHFHTRNAHFAIRCFHALCRHKKKAEIPNIWPSMALRCLRVCNRGLRCLRACDRQRYGAKILATD